MITLARDGVVVGTPQTVQCRRDGGAEATFAGLMPGTYSVTESAGPGTNLANYEPFWRCEGGSEFRSGTSFTVDLAAGRRTECDFLNRLVRTGTMVVLNECRGRSTAGRFRFAIEGSDVALETGCDGEGLMRLPPGTYTLVETAGPDTDPAAYQTVAWCQTGRLGPVRVGGTRVGGIVVRHNEETVCRFINIYLRPF